MKYIVFAFILWAVACTFTIYHHNGTLDTGKEVQKVFGVIMIELSEKFNKTYITGMVEGEQHHHHSFAFEAKIGIYQTKPDGSFFIDCTFVNGRIGKQFYSNVKGKCNLVGNQKVVYYFGIAFDDNKAFQFSLNVVGNYTPCANYKKNEAAYRAAFLIGESAFEYDAVHVINYAVLGYPYLPNAHIDYYYDYFGEETAKTAPGIIIIGKDWKHIAIIDKEGDKFIHSIKHKKVIVSTPLSQIGTYFPEGFILKDYDCVYIDQF